MKPGIVVVVEQRGGEPKRASIEALAEAARLKAALGGPVVAVVVGAGAEGAAERVAASGADRIVRIDTPEVARYSTEAYAAAAAAAVRTADAGTVFVAATTQGRDLAPAIAARLDAAYAAECTALRVEGGRLLAARPVYAGKALLTVAANAAPFVVGLRPNVFDPTPPAGTARAESAPAPAFSVDGGIKAMVTAIAAAAAGKKDVAEADIVVAGGRGLGSPEGFKPLEDLATVLGAAVGASRAVVDLGWRPHSEQVGQTGKVVSPKLYIAAGISGAIQHVAGMRTSKVIVAINRDPEAPIFKLATYGIVGDALQILPALTAALKTALAR